MKENSGTTMGFIYEQAVEKFFTKLQEHCQRTKAKLEMEANAHVPIFPASVPQPVEKRVEQRRVKEKTRSASQPEAEVNPHIPENENTTKEPQPIKVDRHTFEVFTTLFSKSDARGSVNWAAFESAMSKLEFSVVPKYGSVYTFFPPDGMVPSTPLTVHRPHQSKLEGFKITYMAKDLHRVYGWTERSFELAVVPN
jgi:hypothetical protein